ncbi:caspase family protein [Tabrizicola sp.]|uniref:caspase family protein n=1 Tax=Tabrizicola sp. TaxID=2005166 RepID=UPI001A5D95B1|nr:caspase family protein [Tabrizicola sp.]MBL9072880.1 caspase family protein [Tabrizicola sp.]
MPGQRILAKCGAAVLLLSGIAVGANAQDATLGAFPEGHVPASARKLAPAEGARQKYAIVIGNQSYAHAPQLPNAWNDALDVADLLAVQGYDVTLLKDASKRDFEGLMQRVLFDVDRETEVLFYYAGHGVQIGSENYLIPTDAQLDQVDDLPFEAVSLGSLVSILGARARLQIVILDSCRNNPFAGLKVQDSLGPDLREIETGFASLAAPVNSYVVFSTSPGEVALDGAGENSPFASAFLQAAARGSVPLTDVFKDVRRKVFVETEGVQVPWDSSTMVEEATIASVSTAPDTTGPTEDNGTSVARGLTLFAASSAELLPVDATLPTPDIGIAAPLAPAVPIGATLAQELALAPTDTVGLAEPPRGGRLVLLDDQGLQSAPIFPLSAEELQRLAFAYVSGPTVAFGQDPVLKVQFKLDLNGAPKLVQVDLTPDPCDLQAADHLDPEGVGLARFANEIEPEAALLACQAAVAREPQNARFHYQLGRAFAALRRHDEARAEWDTARKLGHSRASYAIGNAILNEGRETGGSAAVEAPEEALAYYREGVELGDPYAFYALGRQMVRYGKTGQDRLRGYDLLMRALEVGHTYAMNELGYFYLDEKSEYYDPTRGLRYLNESADRGDIYGYNNLGLVYMNGLGGQKKDAKLALDWFTKAADGGHPNAPGNIGTLIASGALGKKADLGQAVEWFDKGLERGDANAGAYAAYLILTEGAGGLSPADAAYRAGRAAALRDKKSVERARKVLDALPVEAVDEAAQRLLQSLGADVTPDGAFGEGSKTAYQAIASQYGAPSVETDPVERLIAIARIHWSTTPFRVDLY